MDKPNQSGLLTDEEINGSNAMGVAKAQRDLIASIYQQKTEALIECLGVYENELGFCEISNHIPYSDFKATHTSGEAVKRNTAADPETGVE